MKKRLLLYSCLFVLILSLSTLSGCRKCTKEDVINGIQKGVDAKAPGPKPSLPPGCEDYPPPPTSTPTPKPSGTPSSTPTSEPSGTPSAWSDLKKAGCRGAANLMIAQCESDTLNTKKYKNYCTKVCTSSCVHDLCSQMAGNTAYRHCMAIAFPGGC